MSSKKPIDDFFGVSSGNADARLKELKEMTSAPSRLRDLMDLASGYSPKLTVKRGGALSVELPVKPPASFQTRVNNELRTPAEVAANLRSPFSSNIDGSPAYKDSPIDGVTSVGPDDDVELNAIYRFRLEPDDGQPVEFVGSLIARAAVQRGDSQHTWIGLYKTRGGKVISEIVRDDGRARNVAARLGDRFRSVKVFDNVEEALASIRSAVLRNQLLGDLGLLKTKFIE